MQEVQPVLQRGTIVRSRYRVEDVLGRGGFGAVYLVRDLRVKNNLFALKEVSNFSKKERDRFAFEGEVLKRLDHYALPRVYRVFEDDKNRRSYMLMDYVEGPNLETLRRRQPEKRFSLPQVLTLLAPIVDAVQYLHSQKPPIIHRDIKPANIIVPSSGENTILVDFGIAKEYDQNKTTTEIRSWSPGYGAPEQYARGTNPRTDVYGLAATCYVLLAGIVPTDALNRMTQLGSMGTDPLEPLHHLAPHVPLFVTEAIERAMAINSSERFATAQQFWQALNAHPMQPSLPEPIIPLLETPRPVAHPPTDATTASRVAVSRRPQALVKRKRRILPVLLVLAALVAGIIFGTGILSVRSQNGSAPVATHPPQATATHIPKPTTRATPKPTSPYHVLAADYVGTIHNTPAQVASTMSLTHIQQNGMNFKGYLTLGADLQGNGNFTGTVSQDKKIQFLVEPFATHLPLWFQGQINADGGLSGTYCSARNHQCDPNGGGYGTWSVSPPSPSSLSPSSNPQAS
ncbi:MAG: serine/threonine protein kinase [Ktedonobacteraceae bacterium]|nr:serine/threonine protein kinase [Ktedonobacteraceae bacterium]